jgi:serine/threonine protein kinase
MGRIALGLYALLAISPVQAQTDAGDALGPPPVVSGPKTGGDPLQGQAARIKTLISVGAQSGIDPNTTFTLPTDKGAIVIRTVAEKSDSSGKNRGPNWEMNALIVALLVFAAAILWRSSNEKRVATARAPGNDDLPFTIVRAVGEGGMGIVYEAVDRALDRRVAVKKLRGDASDSIAGIQNLIKEAKTVAGLHHPNIVDIHSVVSQGGEHYLVFEYVEGRNVDELLKEHKTLNLKEVQSILGPVCQALEFAHAHGVVHRDLKPANVMITTLGQVKVMDFGIARRLQTTPTSAPGAAAPLTSADVTLTNTFAGTPLYASPEAFFGQILPQSDVYSLGVMAYRMLAGHTPYDRVPAPGSPPPGYMTLSMLRPGLPPALDALIAQSLEQDPFKRLASPRLFRERLGAL